MQLQTRTSAVPTCLLVEFVYFSKSANMMSPPRVFFCNCCFPCENIAEMIERRQLYSCCTGDKVVGGRRRASNSALCRCYFKSWTTVYDILIFSFFFIIFDSACENMSHHFPEPAPHDARSRLFIRRFHGWVLSSGKCFINIFCWQFLLSIHNSQLIRFRSKIWQILPPKSLECEYIIVFIYCFANSINCIKCNDEVRIDSYVARWT